jgi:hypothetical protein
MASQPDVFQGLRCDCGKPHTTGANYYVSLVNGTSLVLAAGPYAEHRGALAEVELVYRLVSRHSERDPDAPTYRYGTTAMPSNYTEPGTLNALLATTRTLGGQ